MAVVRLVIALCLLAYASPAYPQEPQQPPAEPFQRLDLKNASIFDADEILWLLRLRPGDRLPAPPEELAERLTRIYHREGYVSAKVQVDFAAPSGVLTVTVDEGRIDGIEFAGAPAALQHKLDAALSSAGVRSGEPYNETLAERVLRRALAPTLGAFRLGDVRLVDRGGKQVLVVPVRPNHADVSVSLGTDGREDFFSPVDAFAPALALRAVVFDPGGGNYTFVGGFASWKFGRDDGGYSLGIERPLVPNTKVFVGGEMHDLTASDDLWRITAIEQSVVALTFKNTFRDYYRRRGAQLHVGARPGRHHEFVASWRWDRHEPLPNETDFSFFRDDHEFRPNPLVLDADLNAIVFAYTFDTRGLDDQSIGDRYDLHLVDDLFRSTRRTGAGWRADWTSEIAGESLGGDHDFDRHILNVRGLTRFAPRQTIAARALLGWSNGTLPIEREFALGGVGSVHGYGFKEVAGRGMTLFNTEYAIDLLGNDSHAGGFLLRGLVFYDAGRVSSPIRGSDDWLQGIGVGLQTGPLRVEFGFRVDDIPDSRQILVRLGRGF